MITTKQAIAIAKEIACEQRRLEAHHRDLFRRYSPIRVIRRSMEKFTFRRHQTAAEAIEHLIAKAS